MCEPISASLALMAAGTAAQMQGQKKAQKAMSAAQEAEATRQKRLRGEGEGIFNKSLGRLGAENQRSAIDQAGKKRGEQMAGAQDESAPIQIDQSGAAPNIINEDTSARVSDATSKARQRALAEGFLGGYNDVSLSNALENSRANQGIGVLNNMRQGSQGVLGLEMNNASMAGDRWNNIGKGLSTAGSLVGLYGAMAPAAAATTAGGTTASTLAAANDAATIADAGSIASTMNAYSPLDYSFLNGAYSPVTSQSIVPSFLPNGMSATNSAGSTIPSFLNKGKGGLRF